jgi:hypothetical protein
MKEREYIASTNRVKVSMALKILRDVLPGEEYGITDIQLSEIVSRLAVAEDNLFQSYKCTADNA